MIKKTIIYKLNEDYDPTITISTTEDCDGVYFSINDSQICFINYKQLEELLPTIKNDFLKHF